MSAELNPVPAWDDKQISQAIETLMGQLQEYLSQGHTSIENPVNDKMVINNEQQRHITTDKERTSIKHFAVSGLLLGICAVGSYYGGMEIAHQLNSAYQSLRFQINP